MFKVIEVYHISWNTLAMKQSTIFQKNQKLLIIQINMNSSLLMIFVVKYKRCKYKNTIEKKLRMCLDKKNKYVTNKKSIK